MTRPKNTTLSSLLLTLSMLAILHSGSGCAVLTVDVDVYKGPLANQFDIQIQQAAATATAAQPLLGKLRFELEKYARIRVGHRVDTDPSLMRLSNSIYFIPPYEPGSDPNYDLEKLKAVPGKGPDKSDLWRNDEDALAFAKGDFYFRSPQAAFVNRILAEYNSASEEESLSGRYKAPNIHDHKQQNAIQRQQELRVRRGDQVKLGLQTLVQNYLEARAKSTREDAGEKERDALFDALVQFSQLTLYAANNEALFEYHIGFPRYLQAAMSFVFEGGTDPRDSKHSYVRVLQSVGNSILSTLNELRENLDQRKALANHSAIQREMTALESAFRQTPDQILWGFQLALQVEITQNEQVEPLQGGQTLDAAITAAGTAATTADTARQEKEKAARIRQNLLKMLKGRLLTSQAALDTKPLEAANGNELLTKLKAAAALEAANVPATAAALNELKAALENDNDVKTAISNAAGANPQEVLNKAVDAVTDLAGKANADMTKAQDEAKAAQTRVDRLNRRKTLQEGLAALKVTAPKIVANVKPEDRTPSAETVFDRLLRQLQADRDAGAAAPAPTKAQYDAAIALVQNTPPPTAPITLPSKPESQKDVVDSLIATLTYEHLEAVKRNGKDSPIVKQIEDALEAAYLRRADMMYIRPAASYLRTSFPASSLQRDSRIGWSNMLAEHGQRQIPFLGRLTANGSLHDFHTILELDKQNWQNINTVRVAGGGNTNYVVAKDDIGNWYVKNYSADPKDIIKSASGLAMFALGPAMKTATSLTEAAKQQTQAADLATRDSIPATAKGEDKTGTSNEAVPATKAPSAAMKEARAAYTAEADKDFTAARDASTGMGAAVLAKWNTDDSVKAVADKLQPGLTEVSKQLQKAVSDANISTRDKSLRVTDLLVAIVKFESDLRSKTKAALAGTDGGDVTAAKAADLALTVVRERAGSTYESWSTATDKYAGQLDDLAKSPSK